MNVIGIDFSSWFIDLVLVDLDDRQPPRWHRYPLAGTDAFDRARSVADAMPGRSSVYWDNTLAVGIEEPQGKSKATVAKLKAIQGAVLAQIPARMLVQPFQPAEWRRAVGLPGNASKDHVHVFAAANRWNADPRFIPSRDPRYDYQADVPEWPQDAHDAYCIAVATRQAITTQEAA